MSDIDLGDDFKPQKLLEVTTFPPIVRAAGDPRSQDATWILMPPSPELCSQCACDHEPDVPHNQDSLYWQYAFRAEAGRWPTWADAIAHCTPEVQTLWRDYLQDRGIEVD